MKKILSFALVIAGAFLFTPSALAQFTTVTATVTDPNGIPYGNGTMSAVLVPSAPGGFRLSGQPYSGRVGPLTLDSTGHFTANFGDVTLITPSAQWQITVNSNQGGILPPLGTGAQTFVFTSSGTTISGSSPVDISASLNALAPKLTNITVGGSVTSVAATSPIIATPSPITGTGTLSCPTCLVGSPGNRQILFSNGTQTAQGDSVFIYNAGSHQFQFTPPDIGTGSIPFQITESGTAVSAVNDIVAQINSVPTAAANTAAIYQSLIGSIQPAGTGNYTGQLIGVTGQLGNSSSGNITNAYLLRALSPTNTGGGTFTNLYGLYSDDMKGLGGTVTAAFNAAAQTAGANNFGFLSAATNKDQFGLLNAVTYSTATNCSSSASPAVCGSAAAGTVVVAAGATTVVVNTTAVTANSEIFLQYDSSLGTKLSVTCNTTAAIPSVTARTAATSFTITIPAAPVTNPACYSYKIVN